MIDKRIQYRVGGASGREYDQGGNQNTKSTKSNPNMGGGGGKDSGKTTGPIAPPTTFIGGKQFNVTPFNRDERERADLKARLMRGPVSGNFNRVDPITGQSKRSVGAGLGSFLGTILGLITGNPFVSLAMGGFDRLKRINQRLQDSDFGRSKGFKDYMDIRSYGGYDKREEARRKNMEETGILRGLIEEGQFGLPTSNRERALLGIPSIIPNSNFSGDINNFIDDRSLVPDRGLNIAPGDNIPPVTGDGNVPLSPNLNLGLPNDLYAFKKDSLLDKKIKQANQIYQDTGGAFGKDNLIELMEKDIKQNQEEGAPLSLPKQAYSLIG
tara:strand:- start:36 stop:1013 length:978 start_codon:yes stop_codon:yes gene_type:complete